MIGDDPTAAVPDARAHRGLDVHPLPSRPPRADGNYSHRELEEWARRIEGWAERVDVYAYFNNDWEGYAVKNGLWLKKRLGQ